MNEDDINALSNHETFARFIQSVEYAREQAIQDLHGSGVDGVQQISGRICAYDDILNMVNWDKLRVRHREALV